MLLRPTRGRRAASLVNIFTELESDLGCPRPDHGNLEHWARQGVLLLNATLTVRARSAASHQRKGWETFTDRVLEVVNDKPERVVFILWGSSARRKKALIDTRRHTVLESPHPSPLSAHRGFFGSRPFSRANAALGTRDGNRSTGASREPATMTGFAEVAATATVVAATTKRNAKKQALADLLARLEPAEVEPVVGFLVGELRQGRIGIGWATISGLEVTPAPAPAPSLSVADVDAAVTDLAATTGSGSQAARRQLLEGLFSRATAAEADLLGRLFVGEIRTGALAGVVTDAVAQASGIPATKVRRAVMLAGDLGEVARLALTEGTAAVTAVTLQPLRAVQPMLASTSASVADAVGELGRSSVEWKLDGARIQVHRVGDQVRVFTRNLNDVTDRVPEVVEVALGFDADAFVLDGEVLGFLGPDESPQAFQDTMSRFGRDDGTDHPTRLVPWFFDVLHLDGDDLVDAPLVERRERLETLAGNQTIPFVITDDVVTAESMLEQSLGRGHEGVLVKAADSAYEAGRRGKSWRKVKPVHTLDLVVLAVEWGHGRRTGLLSNLHLGARDPETGDFVMVGKTFKGLTDDLLAWQTQRFRELATRETRSTVWVLPEQVVEIAVDGAQTSSRYAGGVALRFARVVRYRHDKGPDEADTHRRRPRPAARPLRNFVIRSPQV